MTEPDPIADLRSQLAAMQGVLDQMTEAKADPAAAPPHLNGVTITPANNQGDGYVPPPRETVESARAEARRRGGNRESAGATATDADVRPGGGSTAAEGRAEALRRLASRGR